MQHNGGFTLIEMLVSVALASVLTVALLGAFVSFLQYQAIAQEERSALETVRFFLAEVSRELQFGYGYTCAVGTNERCTCIAFFDQLGRRVKVRYTASGPAEKSVKYLDPNPDACPDTDTWVPLTDDTVTLTEVIFGLETAQGKQPRVTIRAEGHYETDGERRDLEMKTQVTRRILETTQTVADRFRIGTDTAGPGTSYYLAFGPEPNPCLNSSDTNCGTTTVGAGCTVSNLHRYLKSDCDSTDTVADANQVCRDEDGNVYPPASGVTPCDHPVSPIAAEFTTDGLYVLADNGLLFFIKQNTVDSVLTATGILPKVFVLSSDIQKEVEQVTGESGSGICRFCDNDPRNIVAIIPGKEALYARGTNGSLYAVKLNGSGKPVGKRLFTGGAATDTVRHVSVSGKRTLTMFRDGNGGRIIRLYTKASDTDSLTAADITGTCPEFQYVPSSAGCGQIWPDTQGNSRAVKPDLLRTELSGISLSLVDRVQTINDTVTLWYQDSSGNQMLSVGGTGKKKKRGGVPADGGGIAYGNGLAKYTFICGGGSRLCEVADLTGNTTVKDAALSTGTLERHEHFSGYPVGITGEGRLIYFSASDIANNGAITVYDNAISSPRVLCRTVPQKVGSVFQQVFFTHLSGKHPTKNLMALVGRSTRATDGQETVSEVYLLEPRSAKAPYTGADIDTVCGTTDHVERYRLPSGNGPALDLLRLTDVSFIVKK